MKKILNSILCLFVCLGMVSTLSAQCDYTLTLDDSAGDGWFFQSVFSGNILEEATLDVLVNGVEVATYPENQDGFASIDFTLTLETDDEVTFVYNTNDGFDNEHSWSLTDPDGAVVFTQAFALSSDATDGEVFGPVTAVCPVAPVPCTVICPDDFFESLESGECNTQVDFVVETEGDCELVVETSFGFTAEWIDRLFVFGSTDANGFTDFSGLPDQLVITSGDDQSGAQELDGALIEVLEDGVFTFDYATENMDVIATGFDILIVQVFDNANMDGFTFQLANQVAGDEVSESGTISLDLTAGQAVGIVVFTFDSSDGPIVATISNASFAVTTDEVVVSTFPIESGDQVDGGTDVTNTAQATDANTGLPVSCTFDITINEYTGTPQSFLQCAGGNTISLDDNCTAIIGAEDVLVGGPYQCFDDYTVVITDADGNVIQPASNEITAPGVVYYTVSGPNGETPCWNSLIAEDKTGPSIECEDVTVGCNDATSVAAIGQPTVDETCGGVSLSHVDVVINGTCADGYLRQIFRTFTATSANGMTDECTQIITVNRQALADVVAPSDYDGFDLPTISCDDPRLDNPFFIDENGNPSAENWTGVPTVNGEPATEACGLQVSYEDELQYPCEGTTKIFRTWTIIDWCVASGGTFNNRLIINQFIKIEDKGAPTVTSPAEINVSTDFDACTADVLIPVPVLSDNCADAGSLTYTATLDTPDGILVALPSGGYVAQGLPVGKHTVSYRGVDPCGNVGFSSTDINVADEIAPAMSCESFRQVSLQNINPNEPTIIFAQAFDDGSYDNCEIEKYEVRRMAGCIAFDWTTAGAGNDSDPNGFVQNPDRGTNGFYPAVPFACCDLGNTVMVELRITDIYGNSNSCMVEVEVVDKVNPIIACPADVTIECADEVPGYDFLSDTQTEEFNTPAYAGTTNNPGEFLGYYNNVVDNCGAIVYIRESGGVNECGVGQINRSFRAIDASGNLSNACTQRVRIINSDPFDIVDTQCRNFPLSASAPDIHVLTDDVEWPCDLVLTCGVDPSPAGLEALLPACSSPLSPAQCKLDARPQLQRNDECDIIAMTYEDFELPIVNNEECRKILRTWTITDHCQFELNNSTGVPTAGFWQYTQLIKITDNEAPVLECNPIAGSYDADPNTCDADITLEINSNSNNCVGEILRYTYVIEEEVSLGNYVVIASGEASSVSGTYDIGAYRITWSVEDYCGNVGDDCVQLFYVVDNTAPQVYALTSVDVGLIAQGDGTGLGEIWASELDLGSYDVCSGVQEVLIQNPSGGLGQSSPNPATSATNAFFNCADLGLPVNVDLWVLDGAGNWGYVIVQVVVEDNNGIACGPGSSSATVAGTIATEEDVMVENATVSVDGSAATMPTDVVTENDGSFGFNVEMGQNYSVEANRNDNPLNGVTTYDLILMGQHILGMNYLDSPYKMIAADINASGSISSLDMIALRKMILFIDTEFANNNSWRFVDADYTFANPTNPFATTFPEVINYNDLSGDQLADFVGVKIGDLNGSVIANSLQAGDTRSSDKLELNVADAKIAAGQTHTIEFTAKDFNQVAGYQFTLNFDKNAVEFVDFDAAALRDLTAENFGFAKLNEGVITTSWNTTDALTVADDEVLFSLTFVAKSATQLSKVINIAQSTDYTQAEAYDSDAKLYDLAINFNTGDYALFQNQPNPFRNETVIGFELAEAATATLTIYDVAGRTLKQVAGDYAQGYNEVTINRSELSGTGVLYYQLDTPEFSATKKMILVD